VRSAAQVGRETGGADALVEEYTAREGAEMTPIESRQQGRRADHDFGEIARAMAKAGSTNLVDVPELRRSRHQEGFCPSWTRRDTTRWRPPGRWRAAPTWSASPPAGRQRVRLQAAPSIKLATNSAMFKRMEDDMDVNCGTILDGEETVQQCGQRIFDLMLKTASGQPTKSESFDFGGAESHPGCLGLRCRPHPTR